MEASPHAHAYCRSGMKTKAVDAGGEYIARDLSPAATQVHAAKLRVALHCRFVQPGRLDAKLKPHAALVFAFYEGWSEGSSVDGCTR